MSICCLTYGSGSGELYYEKLTGQFTTAGMVMNALTRNPQNPTMKLPSTGFVKGMYKGESKPEPLYPGPSPRATC